MRISSDPSQEIVPYKSAAAIFKSSVSKNDLYYHYENYFSGLYSEKDGAFITEESFIGALFSHFSQFRGLHN